MTASPGTAYYQCDRRRWVPATRLATGISRVAAVGRSNFPRFFWPPEVRWNSVADKSVPDPPTAVFIHGILGGRKNWTYKRQGGKMFQLLMFFCKEIIARISHVAVSLS